MGPDEDHGDLTSNSNEKTRLDRTDQALGSSAVQQYRQGPWRLLARALGGYRPRTGPRVGARHLTLLVRLVSDES